MVEGLWSSSCPRLSRLKNAMNTFKHQATCKHPPQNNLKKRFSLGSAYLALVMLWVLLLPAFVQAQQVPVPFEQFDRLKRSIEQSAGKSPAPVDLSDFIEKAETGLAYMAPEFQLLHPTVENRAVVSPEIEGNLFRYITELYRDFEAWPAAGLQDTLRNWRGFTIATLVWGIAGPEVEKSLRSVAVFDADQQVIFDSELVNFIASVDEEVNTDLEGRMQLSSGSSQHTDSDKITKSVTVNGIFRSSVKLSYTVAVSAEVARYITSATNDATLSVKTTQMKEKREPNGTFPPPNKSVVWFGSGGKYADQFSNAVPYKSTIKLLQHSDEFVDGNYKIEADDGSGKSWELGISVSSDCCGLAIGTQSKNPFTLIAPPEERKNELFLGSRLYAEILPGLKYRGIFWDGGSLTLSNFRIRTGDTIGEIGYCDIDLPVGIGHTVAGVFNSPSQTLKSLDLQVAYIRGDHIQQPQVTMQSARYAIKKGDEITVNVGVFNASNEVDIESGEVSIDVSSLGDKLELMSPGEQSFGLIEALDSKQLPFTFKALADGVVTPQADMTANWAAPIPPEVDIAQRVTLDSNLLISTATSNEHSEAMMPTEISLAQNYPNPFNAETTIPFQLAETNVIQIKVFNTLGQEVRLLADQSFGTGAHRVQWDGRDNSGQKVPDGLYLYQIRTPTYVDVRKMTIIR